MVLRLARRYEPRRRARLEGVVAVAPSSTTKEEVYIRKID